MHVTYYLQMHCWRAVFVYLHSDMHCVEVVSNNSVFDSLNTTHLS